MLSVWAVAGLHRKEAEHLVAVPYACDCACADTFLDAEESEEEDADKGAYDYKDLAAAFDKGGFDGLSQSDTSGRESMSEGDEDEDEDSRGPFKPAAMAKKQKQKGKALPKGKLLCSRALWMLFGCLALSLNVRPIFVSISRNCSSAV